MSRRKKIIVALSVLFIFGIFMFGATEDEKNFVKNTESETFKLIKFSTVNYPTLTATLYLATDKKNPVFSLYDQIYDGSSANLITTIVEKVTKPLKVDIGSGGVDGQSSRITIYDEGNLLIKATDIDYLSGETKGSNGLEYYKVEVEYLVVPSQNTDSAKFEISNEKDNDGNKASSSILNYFTYKIQAEFTTPTPTGTTPKTGVIIKEETGVTLVAKASATKMRGEYTVGTSEGAIVSDSNTTITSGTTYNTIYSADNSTEDDPITSGVFEITGYKSDDGVNELSTIKFSESYPDTSLVFLNEDSDKNKWYEAERVIPLKEFNEKFGKKPKGVVIKYTATARSGKTKTIELSVSDIIERVNPKITNITTINKTLEEFMKEIKLDNSLLYTQTITNSNGIKLNDLSNKLLNAKEGDEIEVQFTVDDENITSSKGKLIVEYNGVLYNYGNGGANSIEYKGINGTKTTWKMTIPNYNINSDAITFDITDASQLTNNLKIENLTVFTNPTELDNTKINQNTTPAGTTTYSDYYKNTSINIDTSGLSDAIAYMVVYDLDKSKSDSGLTGTLSNQWKAVLKTTPTFTFGDGDGEYKYAEVYTINKAGAIKGITSSSINTFESIQKAINSKDKNLKFYIDTVAPRVNSYEFWKYSNGNTNEIDDSNSLVISLLLGQNKPYKSDDVVGIKARIKEYNMAETSDTSGIITWNVIPTVGTYDITDGAIYEKKGTALDLTPSSLERVDKSISSTFYDKAGNSTLSSNTNIIYDDREPKVVETKASEVNGVQIKGLVNGVETKYTKDINLPLIVVDNSNFAPVSLAMLGLKSTAKEYIGAISNTGATNLVSFDKISNISEDIKPTKNGENNLEMDVYSHSGVKKPMSDKIVLDTEINYVNSNINDNSYTKDTNYNVINLNNLLDFVTELVGLKSFKVTKTGLGDKSLISDNGTDRPLGTSISLNDYSNYNASWWSSTSYSNLSPSRKYELKIPKGVKGKLVYKIELEDRLGHKKIVNYTTIVSEETKIIGKTNGSSKEVVTKIKTGNNVKINSRTEGK